MCDFPHNVNRIDAFTVEITSKWTLNTIYDDLGYIECDENNGFECIKRDFMTFHNNLQLSVQCSLSFSLEILFCLFFSGGLLYNKYNITKFCVALQNDDCFYDYKNRE